MNFFKIRTITWTVATLVLASTSIVVADSDKCSGISGYYGGHTAIIMSEDGRTVNITLDGGRPNAYGSCSVNNNGSTNHRLEINFTDDGGIMQGEYEGKTGTLLWANGTSWTKR